MSLYKVEYDPRTEPELRKLSTRTRRLIDQKLEFLRAAPYRSHPGLAVKSTSEVPGVWHFHAAKDVRVYYTTFGAVLWVVLVERGAGVTRKTIGEVRKRI